MRIRRCSIVLLEPRETREFDLQHLVDGGDGLRARRRWVALAPHLEREVELHRDECLALGEFSPEDWLDRDALPDSITHATLVSLLDKGLLISDPPHDTAASARDQRLRELHWHALSATAHMFGRWHEIDSVAAMDQGGMRRLSDLVERLGPPPPHFHQRGDAGDRIALEKPADSSLSELMAQRTTCRNYARDRSLPREMLATMLHRVFAAHAEVEAVPGATVVKKTSPSGGGLHATGAYLLVRDVATLEPGLYHYHAGAHALEPLAAGIVAEPAELAQRILAGQHWFADAHVLVMLAPRFGRSFWKYRHHAKAYRALILDVGHLSQTLYLTATELGLGAFITSAINETTIEAAFGLDPIQEGPLAVCGFGWRGSERVTVEFDPQHRVWAQ